MNNETLKQIIEQIKKYELTESFSDADEFKKWVSKLNTVQINNFLSLDIELEKIKRLRDLLIDENLLSCKDYKQKVEAISTLKNGEGCWHLFGAIVSPNFLNSKNFYKDIEMLSKADTARYGLWIIDKDAFINSLYHDEDLKLLVETHDIDKENPLDYVVSDAIATVAGNIDSIKSPHHRADMKLIATSGSDALQMSGSYPESSINNLAINRVSLRDKYHLENMQILAKNPIASEFLYEIMTYVQFTGGKYYRKEVEALVNAKSRATARALYYYIVNPPRQYIYDLNYYDDYNYDIKDAFINTSNNVAGREDPDYLKNLIEINKIDDKFIMHYVSLLMNPKFIHSKYKKFDLELLQTVTDKSIFMDLYRLMLDEESLKGIHHKRDAVIISQATIDGVRDLLLEKACCEYSLQSSNHEFDMDYISKLKLDSISEKIYYEMYYYLFQNKGIDDPEHRQKLEKLLNGELVARQSSVASYFNDLENQIENNKSSILVESQSKTKDKPKLRILRLFKK